MYHYRHAGLDKPAPDLIRGHPVSMLVPDLRGCVIIENKMRFSTIAHEMMTDRVDLAIFGIPYQFLLSPWFMLVGAEASNCKGGDRIDQLSSKSDSVSIFSAMELLSDA